jgi:hypothetical protein
VLVQTQQHWPLVDRQQPNVACTESYNGSTWTAGGAMATARRALAGAGASNTAALASGGCTTAAVACTESYSVSSPATCTRTLTIS